MSTYVIGDVHGEFNQLLELLNTMDFSSKDWLYVMGDVADKGEHPIKSLQLLMGLPNCTCLMGNHELMMLNNRDMINNLDNLSTEFIENNCLNILDWLNNGAESTLCELSELSLDERNKILDYVEKFKPYVELNVNGVDYLLVHGGLQNFSVEKPIAHYSLEELVWDRPDYSKEYFSNKILVTGHTPTQRIKENTLPGYIFIGNNHIALDCGAFSPKGKLAGIRLETMDEFYSR